MVEFAPTGSSLHRPIEMSDYVHPSLRPSEDAQACCRRHGGRCFDGTTFALPGMVEGAARGRKGLGWWDKSAG
jgi:hypothetical protein